MERPIYFYIHYPVCRHKNGKERMIAEKMEAYKNVLITVEAANHLAEWLEECVKEANERFPRNKKYCLMKNLRYMDMIPSDIAVSDGTDNYVAHINLYPVTSIIETKEDL